MKRLFDLLYRNGTFFVFLFLEIISLGLVISFNSYPSTAFFNSSNSLAGGVMSITSGVSDYFTLSRQHEILIVNQADLKGEIDYLNSKDQYYQEIALENFLLKKKLKALKNDTLSRIDSIEFSDNGFSNFIPAKIVNNSVDRVKNYLTINKGENDGIEAGMGVITPDGVVGKVISVSGNYSTVMSLLHIDNMISSQISRNHSLGSSHWPGLEITESRFYNVPRHVSVLKGDTIITSGFNSIFPEGVVVGTVKEVTLKESDSFYNIEIDLTVDYNNLYHVLVVKNNNLEELQLINAE